MELEFQSTINQNIQEFICNKKGILNLGYIQDSQRILKILDNSQDLLKNLADMIIQNPDYSQFYNTIILNMDQYSQNLTDKRFKQIEDKSYESLLSNYVVRGVNFKEDIDIQEFLDNRFVYNYELVCFKVDIQIFQTIKPNESNVFIKQNEFIDEETLKKYQEQQQKFVKIAEVIKQLNEQQSDLIYLIDLNINSENIAKENTIVMMEKQLYKICTDNLLQNDIPLQNVIISLNLPQIKLREEKYSNSIEQSAFNSLIMLSHALPASIGGVVITYDGVIEINTFSKYLNEICKLKAIRFFPITFMTHSSNFEYLAQNWKGKDINYIATRNYLYRFSESLEAGLHGNFKHQIEDLVVGGIEIGDLS